MPKVNDTRRQRAAKFLRMLEDGPAFSEPFDGTAFTAEEAVKRYRNWAASWMTGPAKVLIPELREKKEK